MSARGASAAPAAPAAVPCVAPPRVLLTGN